MNKLGSARTEAASCTCEFPELEARAEAEKRAHVLDVRRRIAETRLLAKYPRAPLCTIQKWAAEIVGAA